MPRPSQTRRPLRPSRAGALLRRVTAGLRRLRETARRRWRAVPVQVLVADRRRRGELLRELRAGLRQLRRLLGEQFPRELRVLVQESVGADRPLAGCTRVVRHADGSRVVVVQLALRVDQRRLGADDVLAALAEQCVALAFEQSDGASVLVPLELRLPDPPRAAEHPATPNGVVVDRADGRGWPASRADRRPTPEEVDRWLRS